MNIIKLSFKAIRSLKGRIRTPFYNPLAKMLFWFNDVKCGSNLKVRGPLRVMVTRKGRFSLGDNLLLNSGNHFNPIGRQQRCLFYVDGKLKIGDNVGMSSVAIVCMHNIEIGNNVLMGGNTVIYDTDFHSLDAQDRKSENDSKMAIKKAVRISDNAFIGAHTTILKGVSIGENSIIGACSLVSKNVPANEIWAGNPAKFIKRVGG